MARSTAQTTQEQLLDSLLAAHGDLTECLKMYEDLERIAIEQEAEERLKTERLVRTLSHWHFFQLSDLRNADPGTDCHCRLPTITRRGLSH